VLKYYPFRVADGLFPMFFWIGVALALQRLALSGRRWAVPVVTVTALLLHALVGAMNDTLEGPGHGAARARSLVARVASGEPRLSLYWIKEKSQAWQRHIAGTDRDDFTRMEEWVRANTPPRAVFVIPPWQYSFPLEARRIEFMTFKSNSNEGMISWLARWEALNGGPFHSVGWGMVQETRETYPRLTVAQLGGIRERYRADYVITSTDYGTVLPLIHREGVWLLYQLEGPIRSK
jgi:hypothetical protein